MVRITDADLTRYRAGVNRSLPDACVNSRTGQALIPCRVDDSGKDQRLPGRPNFVKLRTWYVIMPDTTPVQLRDVLTVAGGASYAVTDVLTPGSYHVETRVEAVLVSLDGHGNAVLPEPNALVTFTGTKPGQTVNSVPAVLKATDPNGTLGRFTAEFPWTVDIAEGTAYPDGALVAAKHQITFQRRPGVTVTATLGKSHPDYDAVVPTVSFVFSEQD